jgi:hypothetical protein
MHQHHRRLASRIEPSLRIDNYTPPALAAIPAGYVPAANPQIHWEFAQVHSALTCPGGNSVSLHAQLGGGGDAQIFGVEETT